VPPHSIGKKLIPINKTDNAFFRVTAELFRHAAEAVNMKTDRVPVVDDDGIVTPDKPVRADPFRKADKGINYIPLVNVLFNIISVGRYSKLKVVFVTHTVYFIKAAHKGRGVFCPKNNTINGGRVEPEMGDLPAVHRIPGRQIAAAQAFKKPAAKKGRDVGPSAGGKYQNLLPLHGCTCGPGIALGKAAKSPLFPLNPRLLSQKLKFWESLKR
jgi:hypothetical protein